MFIYGKQIFWHLVQNHPSIIEEVYLAKEIDKKEFSKVVSLGKKIVKLDPKRAQAMAKGGAHQGFLAKVSDIALKQLSELKKHDFLLILSGVTDMGNIGSIVRTARALGVDGIVICQIKDVNLDGAAKASSGALFDIPICIAQNTLDVVNELKQVGFEIISATMDGEDASSYPFKQKKALIMGSEGEGVSKKVIEKSDRTIGITMRNGFDSLNVAIAAAILIDRINR